VSSLVVLREKVKRMSKKIVLVEDDAVSVMLLQKNLKSWGYVLSAVYDTGEEAVAHILDIAPDLLLMDIQLKGAMTGVEAVMQIHSQRKIPVIYVTASEDPETLEKIRQTEFIQIISKPYHPQKIEEALLSFFSR